MFNKLSDTLITAGSTALVIGLAIRVVKIINAKK